MRIGAINQVSYKNRIAKTSFKKTNNVTPAINNQNLKTPTLSQTQAFWGIEFKGEKEVLDLTRQDEHGNTIVHDIYPESIKAFSKALGDKAPETFARALIIRNQNGNTALHLGSFKK